MEELRWCNRCETAKDISFFHKAANKKRGCQTFCKECVKKPEAIKNQHHKELLDKSGLKVCGTCREVKELDQFYDGERRCKSCCIKRATEYSREKRNGWSVDEYELAYKIQEGKCFICGLWKEKLSGDHCHKTGKARKLLCPRCNTMIGMALENPETLRRGAEYCEEFSLKYLES